jgi:leucyl-tRNA synthetase
VLANEQVIGEGVCWRCNTQVTKRNLEQWFFRITNYAEELLDFNDIQWPERIMAMQKNWIGKSIGAYITFSIENSEVDQKEIQVFTTRPDTIFGVTFFLLAPENPLVQQLTTPEQKHEVEQYIEWCKRSTEYERTAEGREKTGVFTGSYVINRLNNEKVPIWITDYVLPGYGTGAVMGVPAHDERDYEFASKFNIPIRPVIASSESEEQSTEAYIGQGYMINSGEFNELSSQDGYEAICDLLENKGWGKRTTTYRLRDWLISRQRYWGAPIPIVYCYKCGIVAVPEEDLPVLLPPDAEFKPTGESPLKYCESFVNTTCPRCGGSATRETDTMDTFMCSSWYFLRYTSPKSDEAAFDPEAIKYWMPVDLYTGGAEHAVLHLLYSRFFIKALRDLSLINFNEPFTHLFNQGTIIYHGGKMSKSKGNVIAPDKYVSEYGADAVRAYLMFIGPWELGGEWSDSGFSGISRWLNRVWRLVTQKYVTAKINDSDEKEIIHIMHKTIKKVSLDMGNFRFNTMLASLMEYTNFLLKVQKSKSVSLNSWNEAIKSLLLLLAPTAPHFTEELWSMLGQPYSIHNQPWLKWDEQLAREKEITLAIQINGKLRDKVVVPASMPESEVKSISLARDRVIAYTNDKEIVKVIYVPGRILNIVVR